MKIIKKNAPSNRTHEIIVREFKDNIIDSTKSFSVISKLKKEEIIKKLQKIFLE